MAQDNIPSLSELYSYKPNADLAQGDRNFVPDDRETVRNLLQGARDMVMYQTNKYNLFQKNLQENFDKFKFDYDGIVPQHREELQKDAAEFYKKLSQNPSVLANPSSNPTAYADIMGSYEKLNSKIAKSKSINTYSTAQDKYMNQNPDLLNEGNRKLIKDSLSKPIDQWEAFELKLPTAIDFVTLSDIGTKESMKENMVDEAIMSFKTDDKGNKIMIMEKGKPKLDAQGNPMYEQYYTGSRRRGTIKKSDKEGYLKYGDALYESNKDINKYGVKIKDAVKDTFSALPPEQQKDIEEAAAKAGEKDVMKYFFKTSWEKFYREKDDLSGIKEFKDEVYLGNKEFDNKVHLELLKQKGDRSIEAFKFSLGQQAEKDQAKALLQLSASTFKDAKEKGQRKKVKLADGTEKEVFVLSLPPQVLNLYGSGASIKTLEGEEVTLTEKDRPDFVEYDPSTKSYNIVVYDKREDGSVKTNSKGWNERKREIRVGEDQFVATLGNSILSKDKLPKAYQYMKEMLGNQSLEDYINSGKQKQVNKQTQQQGTKSRNAKWGLDANGDYVKLTQ